MRRGSGRGASRPPAVCRRAGPAGRGTGPPRVGDAISVVDSTPQHTQLVAPNPVDLLLRHRDLSRRTLGGSPETLKAQKQGTLCCGR